LYIGGKCEIFRVRRLRRQRIATRAEHAYPASPRSLLIAKAIGKTTAGSFGTIYETLTTEFQKYSVTFQ